MNAESTHSHAIVKKLGNVTLLQLKAFVGVCMNMGLVRKPSIDH